MNIAISLALILALTAISHFAFDYRIPGLWVIGLYFAIYWTVSRVHRLSNQNPYAGEPDPDYSDWPTSGPIGRLGQSGLLAVWTATNVLALLNLLQLVQVVRQAVGNVRLGRRESDGVGEWTQVHYRPPFEGEWLLYNGGMTPKTSHSWDALGQRYALDFVVADSTKGRHSSAGTRVADYFCYRQPILAAADGEVVTDARLTAGDRVRNSQIG